MARFSFRIPRPVVAAFESGPRLYYPIEPPQRIAVFSIRAVENGSAKYFPSLRLDELERYAPQALAGQYLDFRALGWHLRHGRLQLTGLDFPLVVFSNTQTGLLTEAQRDELWADYGLPVFEQWRSLDGRLLAYECDAHDGLHLVSTLTSTAGVGPVRAVWTHERCHCGATSPRLLQAPVGSAVRANSAAAD
jgi:hypothetical protein